MENSIKKYSNGKVTVVWKPDLCQHATFCWRGLPGVFNPKVRPWIDPYGASTEQIVGQVEKCPSGALGYFYNKEDEDGSEA